MHAPAPENAGAGRTPSRQPALGIGFSSASSQHQQPQRRCRQDIGDHRIWRPRHWPPASPPSWSILIRTRMPARPSASGRATSWISAGCSRPPAGPAWPTTWSPAAGWNGPRTATSPPAPRTRPGRGRRLRLHRHLRPPRPGPPRPAPALHGAGRRQNYELVLVDCPPSLNGLTRMAWSASDKVALVAEPGLFSVAGTERTMRAIQLFRQEFAPNLSPAGIVANRVRTGSAEHTFRLGRDAVHVRRTAAEPAHPGAGQLAADPGRRPLGPPLARGLGQERRRAVRRAAGEPAGPDGEEPASAGTVASASTPPTLAPTTMQRGAHVTAILHAVMGASDLALRLVLRCCAQRPSRSCGRRGAC